MYQYTRCSEIKKIEQEKAVAKFTIVITNLNDLDLKVLLNDTNWPLILTINFHNF